MSNEAEINLKITAESLDKFCREVSIGSSNTNRKHAAFMALEAFISRHAGATAHTEPYQIIQNVVSGYSEETRSQLMQENTLGMIEAFNSNDTKTIGKIFSSMSRNGFSQTVSAALEQLDIKTASAIREWAAKWCQDAKQQAEAASGYPDALDFRNSDIDFIEYTAMAEINTITNNS